ncbi:hypothetical protein HY797_02485 [Candidatus Falkowbacteria bacterium]|nr:hypothetical protein [Candidatus Falkowbacteria bacterium]
MPSQEVQARGGRGEEMVKKLEYIYKRISSPLAKKFAQPFYKKAMAVLNKE